MSDSIMMQFYDVKMRTTVTIEDRLLMQAKLAATKAGRTLSDLVEDGLRTVLTERPASPADRVTLATYGGSGLRPGVDLEDKDGLTALLDEV